MLWEYITYVASFFTLSPIRLDSGDQVPFVPSIAPVHHELSEGPIFKPPIGMPTGPASEFRCKYPSMKGWSSCSTPNDRGCWLRHDQTGAEYNIHTDYEDIAQTPRAFLANIL